MKLQDKNLLRKIRKGDIKSFESLFHQYYPGMCLFAKSLVKKENVAEEIVQDVFYNIWKNRKNFMLNSGWRNYLYGAVYNNSMQHFRKMKHEVSLENQSVPEQVSLHSGPLDEMNFIELHETVISVLNKMPGRRKKIFSMSRFDGLTYKEIAKNLSISVKTVEANMGKALNAFRTALKEYDYHKKRK